MEAVQLAIDAPAPIGARAAATITDLLRSSGIATGRTGSVVLTWPCTALPFDPQAWTSALPLDADPIAFAHRHRTSRGGGGGWDRPVDQVRLRVRDWAREERLLIAGPWPGDCTFAVALVHDARPLGRPGRGLRARLRRAPTDPLAVYRAVADVERATGAQSALRSIDLLDAADQAQVHALGFALDGTAGIRIASRPGFRRGTGFPTRGYDADAERPADWIEIPLLDEAAELGLPPLLDAGGAAALSLPIERFAGEPGAAALADYAATLERLRALGAWLATPGAIAGALYGG